MPRCVRRPGFEARLWIVSAALAGGVLLLTGARDADAARLAAGAAVLFCGAAVASRRRWALRAGTVLLGLVGVSCLAAAFLAFRGGAVPGVPWWHLAMACAAFWSAATLAWSRFDADAAREPGGADEPDAEARRDAPAGRHPAPAGDNRAANDDGPAENTDVALVALFDEPPYLEAEILARCAGRAWNAEVGTDDDGNERSFVVGHAPEFLVKHGETFLAVVQMEGAFFDDAEDLARSIDDLRLRDAVRRHRAWLSIDLLDRPERTIDDAEAYRLVARLLAELLDEHCLAVCCPPRRSLHLYHEGLQLGLRGRQPLEALSRPVHPPVLEEDADDPRMRAAVEEAGRRWPEFVAAFERRREGQTFSVKAPLCEGRATELVWVDVTALEHEHVYGTLGNEPVALRRHLGERVRVPCRDLNDWLFVDGDRIHGGFTLAVLRDVSRERRRRRASEGN